MRPRLILLAGPNGSGKSTLAAELDLSGIQDVINPDTVRLESGELASAAVAGRIVIHRTKDNIVSSRSFLLETTLSGNRERRVVEDARSHGFTIDLVFVCVQTVEMNIDRVRIRVAQGGHDVPEEDIRRRYDRSLNNLQEILPLVDKAALFDNSHEGHRIVARFLNGELVWRTGDPPAWLQHVLNDV